MREWARETLFSEITGEEWFWGGVASNLDGGGFVVTLRNLIEALSLERGIL